MRTIVKKCACMDWIIGSVKNIYNGVSIPPTLFESQMDTAHGAIMVNGKIWDFHGEQQWENGSSLIGNRKWVVYFGSKISPQNNLSLSLPWSIYWK